jgi:eukaryotic-like serine/threonine-protein kinase
MTAGDSPVHEDNTRAQTHTDVLRQTPPPLFQPGDHLPNLEMWILQRRIGGGGFGEVWLAQHPGKGNAAVKFCTDPAARHKLVTHEKAVVARVMKHCGHHPNVVPLLECNLSGDIPWLMYEYVEGGTLADALDSWRALTPPRRLGKAVLTLYAIAGALGTFHQLSPPLVHRDMKPHNVLMAGAVPRITDFGVGGAALEAAHADGGGPMPDSSLAVRMPTMLQTVGSSKYASPEQMFGSPPSPRDDVYALGVIAYQLILADLKALPGNEAERELRALRIPSDLVALIVKSVALDPQRRPADATEWERRLADLLRKKTATRAPAPKPAPPRDEPTELLQALSDSAIAASAPTQTITIAARGRWYTRVAADRLVADWELVATTPAEVRVTPGEVYRFSIHSAATQADVCAIGDLAGLTTLRYLNLSFCNGVTDDGLARVSAFTNLRQLFLRGCRNITDAGLAHLRALTSLHALELTDSTGLTAEGVDALQEALPNCKIVR